MADERPYLQIPAPSEERHRLFEEWVERQQKQQKGQDDDEEDRRVIVIEI